MIYSCHSCHRFFNRGFIESIYLSFRTLLGPSGIFSKYLRSESTLNSAHADLGPSIPRHDDRNDKNYPLGAIGQPARRLWRHTLERSCAACLAALCTSATVRQDTHYQGDLMSRRKCRQKGLSS